MMKKSCFIIVFYIAFFSSVYSHDIIGEYSNGNAFCNGDTLRDGNICTFSHPDHLKGNWKIELAPYNQYTILKETKDSTAVTLEIVSPKKGMYAWKYAAFTEDGNMRIANGRVCFTDTRGHTDTVYVAFDVLPRRPHIISGKMDNLIFDEFGWIGCGDITMELQVENTNSLSFLEDFGCTGHFFLVTETILPNPPFSGRHTILWKEHEYGYLLANAVNDYGYSLLSDTINTLNFLEDEALRDSIWLSHLERTDIRENRTTPVMPALQIKKHSITISSNSLVEATLVNMQGITMARTQTQNMHLPEGMPTGVYIIIMKLQEGIVSKKLILPK